MFDSNPLYIGCVLVRADWLISLKLYACGLSPKYLIYFLRKNAVFDTPFKFGLKNMFDLNLTLIVCYFGQIG